MATVNVSHELDVISKFTCLMQESVAGESLYIRAKETLQAIYEDNSIDSVDKGQVVANVIGSMASSITNAAMATALQWAARERELALEKLKLGKELDILDKELLLREAQIDKMKWDNIATQAQTIRMYGTPSVVDGVVLSLADAGKVWTDIKLGEQQRTNMVKELDVLDGRLKESYANIHRTVADTVVNHGAWNYTINAGGVSTTPVRVPNAVVPLSDVQRVIAAEQAKGYSYNAWANAVTSSAGMLGTAIASDGAISDIAVLVTDFRLALQKLQQVTTPSIPTS